MKPHTRLCLAVPRRPSSAPTSSSSPSSISTKPPFLPFLYPSQLQTRSYSLPSSSSTSSSKKDPWSFLLGTAESDSLPPPPFTSQPRERITPKDRIPGYYPTLSHYQERFREKLSSTSSSSGSSSSSIDPTYSTITERERAIFASIFESILSESSGGSGSLSSALPRPNHRVTRAPTPTLTALFESAVGPQYTGKELSFGPTSLHKTPPITAAMARASAIAEYPPSIRFAFAHAAGLPKAPLTRQEEEQEAARQLQLVSNIRDMQSCSTDLELIQYMDKHVFSMVNSDSPSSSDSLEIKGKKYTFPSSSYADLLAEGIRLLRKTFRDLSGALSIFERIKSLGAESYVVGCSVTVYNHVLEANWEAYRDITKIEDILEEMRINGIEGDNHTVEILRILTQDASKLWKTDGRWAQLSEAEMETLFRVEGVAANMLETIRIREEGQWNISAGRRGGVELALAL